MRLEKTFEVTRSRNDTVACVGDEATLVELFPDGQTEIVGREGDRITTRTRYKALGREGVATFHFTHLLDGTIRFSKVCDGNVWKQLRGQVNVEEEGDAASRVVLELEGRTKSLVPEFTIRGQMESQIGEMAEALRQRLKSA